MTAAAPVVKRVDILRRAATLMRERAVAATPGPWDADVMFVVGQVQGGRPGGEVIAEAHYTIPREERHRHTSDANHIASWHPLVAFAAAEMLEEFARLDDQGIHPPTSVVTLAKRYLGETS